MERKSNQWLLEFCPPVNVEEGCGWKTRVSLNNRTEIKIDWRARLVQVKTNAGRTCQSKLPNPVRCA